MIQQHKRVVTTDYNYRNFIAAAVINYENYTSFVLMIQIE